MVHRRLVYICLLNVPSFSSRYFNKIKRTSRLGRLLALSLEILWYVTWSCLKKIPQQPKPHHWGMAQEQNENFVCYVLFFLCVWEQRENKYASHLYGYLYKSSLHGHYILIAPDWNVKKVCNWSRKMCVKDIIATLHCKKSHMQGALQ